MLRKEAINDENARYPDSEMGRGASYSSEWRAEPAPGGMAFFDLADWHCEQ